MNSLTKRNRQVVNWRQADELRHNNSGLRLHQDASLPNPATTPQENNIFLFKLLTQNFKRVLGGRLAASSSSVILALVITIVIISTQLFIVHHYVSDSSRRRLLAHMNLKGLDVDSEGEMLANSKWLCQSFAHLNKIALLARKFHIQVVVVDPDLLDLLAGDLSNKQTPEELEFSGEIGIKAKQEANQKTVIHLALVNETSGGQPNLKLFYNALKLQYHMLKYDDSSETMAPEVYRRQVHQLDDVQSDALLDSRLKRLEEDQREMSKMVAQGGERGQQQHSLEDNFEISKIYTEFMSHIFILNSTRAKSMERMENQNDYQAKQQQQNVLSYKNKCLANADPEARLEVDESQSFVAIHLFILYNYEFRPERQWIQSSLSLDEIDRHKLLAYGVHSIDFRLPLDHYYLHEKRQTRPLEDARSMLDTPVRPERPLMQSFNVFVPNPLLDYVNNTYQHCKPSLFNISALIDANRPMSLYLKSLDVARPLQSNGQKAILTEQLYVAVQFMNVFSKTYGNFSFWLTGSSLLNYHKFCQLLVVAPQIKPLNKPRSPNANQEDEDILSMLSMEEEQQDYSEREAIDEKTMWNLELGLFESELDASMLSDLAGAKMIGVTMISNWRHPNRDGLISFHVKDCPNLLFTLHFYQLRRDFYQHYYVTNDNMIYGNKFRRRKSKRTRQEVTSRSFSNESYNDSLVLVGHHVFTTTNLELCWTRLDHVHPFRVPCDVYDHLRRIYII